MCFISNAFWTLVRNKLHDEITTNLRTAES
jgi:hypothetical protein